MSYININPAGPDFNTDSIPTADCGSLNTVAPQGHSTGQNLWTASAISARPSAEIVSSDSSDYDDDSDENNDETQSLLVQRAVALPICKVQFHPDEDESESEEESKSKCSAAQLYENIIASELIAPDSSTDLAKLLECPICMEIASVPVFVCERGHIVCNTCRTKIVNCPLCQGLYLQIRNYLAEEFIKKCFAKCKFNTIGCGMRFLESDKIAHELDCDFRPFECSLVGELHTCKRSKIRYEKFKDHILRGHQLKGASSDYGEWFETATSDELKLKIDHVNEYAFLECFDKLFLCASEIYDGSMMWWIYLIGSKTEAILFEAEINITHLEKNMSLSWQGPVHSIRVSSKDVFNMGLGLGLGPKTLRPLTTFLPKTKKFEWVVGFHVIKKSSNSNSNII